jgi:hypothetical protein
MAKTIAQLSELAATPSGSNTLPIYDSGVTKKVSVSNLVAAGRTIPDGENIAVGTSLGTKVGTSSSQKLGFFNANPVVQQSLTTDLLDSLQSLGLIASGSGNTPLNLTSGAITAGAATFANVSAADILSDDITLRDGKNIVAASTNGTKIGTSAAQKLGFWNAIPVAQPSGANQAAITNTAIGTADGALVTIGTTYSSTVAGNINNNFADIATLLNEIRSALVSVGIIKGAA